MTTNSLSGRILRIRDFHSSSVLSGVNRCNRFEQNVSIIITIRCSHVALIRKKKPIIFFRHKDVKLWFKKNPKDLQGCSTVLWYII